MQKIILKGGFHLKILRGYVEVKCLHCEGVVKMPKVRGVKYVKWAVIHTKHKNK